MIDQALQQLSNIEQMVGEQLATLHTCFPADLRCGIRANTDAGGEQSVTGQRGSKEDQSAHVARGC